ncbi:hypothetical protein RDV84_02465 [Lysobacter yananisis]|uniref:Uncharacterized protein n=1 Tax=Lysobacter yananisis TaxID=1003114 RepID=A0ABY9PBH8_9GAMM|nr:hypothetical protein [Lysobacter yananisis]WMT03729.1 hypothetical protein RDV84_02465 [Lysobacter yananisis]
MHRDRIPRQQSGPTALSGNTIPLARCSLASGFFSSARRRATDIDPSLAIDVNPGNNRGNTLCDHPDAPWAGATQPAVRSERAPETA